ncbi:UvrD-helicase domain-containing protein [Salinimicrobium xinjiangense]|uniref:UvrD-helicase domain-containing protein n=1 Tax=Salinimicrobium xinjiangense TaxID=438596 RepID=UPI00048D6C5C|nr:UvrD-helicase domain-containing protein [Salinimicrobium xinjiangense]
MFNHLEFISRHKSMLIAPAGFGKTHTIAECLKTFEKGDKQLILTHTHAGVASIKEKIKNEGISSSICEVETITSFAQKYVLAFYFKNDIPDQDDSKNYYSFIIEKAIDLFKLSPIQQIISTTYKGLFVDEYQDCTVKQHNLILLLSELFPTHILGDFLQGIFDFNGEQLVDLTDSLMMRGFIESKYELDKPQRWLNGNNAFLGADLKSLREVLIDQKEVDFRKYNSFELKLISERDLYNPRTEYCRQIRSLMKEKSILLLHPDSTSVYPRLNIIKMFNNEFTLVESIDDKEFYVLSKECDLLSRENVRIKLFVFCKKIFNKTGVANWLNEKGLKRKIKQEDKELLEPIEAIISFLEKEYSHYKYAQLLKKLKTLPGIKCYRRELFNTLCIALEDAENDEISVFDSMKNKRNQTRRIGRKIYGKSIGTTLLTKGLEFDTVAIINAHKFNCPKHLYVAMTRASKRLVIFSNKAKIHFDSDNNF